MSDTLDSLRDALVKVLDTRNREAKATMRWQVARERAMLAANDAEREARVLLLTLRDGA